MKLNNSVFRNRAEWEEKGYFLPHFDRKKMIANTLREPEWVHFGAGNIFRGFPAVLQQNLLEQGLSEKGIIVYEGFDGEIIDLAFRPFDDLSLLVVLRSNGTIDKVVVGSVAQSLRVGSMDDWKRLKEIFRSPSLKLVSFTITEKGYSKNPKSLMGQAALLCLERYRAGGEPLALVSMDNCSHNGEKLRDAILSIAEGFGDEGFLRYLQDENRISFPWSMIDKITPRPDETVRKTLEADGYEDAGIIVTEKNTYTSSFVNAEEAEYLVVEDNFPNGRPPLEAAGLYFTSSDTVNRCEQMKVCTCLNPLHTALAVFGCLLGYKRIYEEMRDPVLRRFVEQIGYEEGLPVVTDPGILRPRDFLREVLEVRLPNPFMPDTPQRIACDTSQKLPVRFGETLKAYLASPDLDIQSLERIPLVFAGWCRYLMGVDDGANPFEPSPDPRLDRLRSVLTDVRIGSPAPFGEILQPILSDASIFGVDLYEAGIAGKVTEAFAAMTTGKGAVRAVLEQAVGRQENHL